PPVYPPALHDALPIFHRGRRRGDRARPLRARGPCDDRFRRGGGPGAAIQMRKMGSVPDFRKMGSVPFFVGALACALLLGFGYYRSEEHTSELQSPDHL